MISDLALALAQRDIAAVFWAILAMLAVIILYDQLLFRPLVAWSAKFRFETTAGATASDPWVLRLVRRPRSSNVSTCRAHQQPAASTKSSNVVRP